MWRHLMAGLVGVVVFTSIAPAGMLTLTMDGLPGAYLPGESFTFDVRLAGAENLASYNIELVLTATAGTPPTDFGFDPLPTAPASGYVFPSSAFFLAAVNTVGSEQRLTLSDFSLTGVNTVAGVNDLIATVTVRTAPTFTGTLSISFDADSPPLFLDQPNINPINGFAALQAELETTPPAQVVAVPEPATLALVLGGTVSLTGLGALRRYRRRPG